MPYVGEVRMFAGNFAPLGWMKCEGQLLSVSENETLFNLIGTTYGGDGQDTFALPDLRGRIPIHQGNGFILAETGGVEDVTLTTNQIPPHSHTLIARREQGNTSNPVGAVPAMSTLAAYAEASSIAAEEMNAGIVNSTGGSQPHSNMMPYLCVTFIISLFGVYPSPT